MFQKTSVSATQTFVYKNRFNSTEVEDINSSNLAFSFYAYNPVELTVVDETVGTFHLYQTIKDGYTFEEGTPIQENDVIEVEIENCHPGSKAFKNNWVDNYKYYY